MKKLAALTLSLALCVGLSVPALAYTSMTLPASYDGGDYGYYIENGYTFAAAEAQTWENEWGDTACLLTVQPGSEVRIAGLEEGFTLGAMPMVENPDAEYPAVVVDGVTYEVDYISPTSEIYLEKFSFYETGATMKVDDLFVEGVELVSLYDSNTYVRLGEDKGAPSVPMAYASTQNVLVNGKSVEFQCYALKDMKGNDTNYVKLRDVAYALNGSSAQFNVGWDGAVNIETGKAYAANGTEMSTPFSGDRAFELATGQTLVDGWDAYLSPIVLKDDAGNGYTYYKLRDLGLTLGFQVDWSAEKGIYIETW